MPTPPHAAPPAHDVIDAAVRRHLRAFLTLRARAAPALIVLGATIAALDPVPWRLGLIGALIALGISLARWSGRRAAQDPDLPPNTLARNLLGMWLMQLGIVTASGGLDSPMLPVLVPISIFSGLLDGRPRALVAIVAVQLAALSALATAQTAGWLPHLPIPWLAGPAVRPAEGRLADALVLGVVCAVANGIGLTLRVLLQDSVSESIVARSESAELWRAQSRDLQVLSAEIAHELKNPLASIHGLAALVARDLPDGRAAERLAVLRGEVDRMTSILEEFLTFSRPLAPLALAPVPIDATVAHVLALHEGHAKARGVQLVRVGAGPDVRADSRKITQILVNLVQNAIDAAPAGTAVTVRTGASDGAARVEVTDRGPGVPPDLRDHVFEPGVTSKTHGSGLGLTVARALAAQHAGALSLHPADGGGTTALLSLPISGPPIAGPPEAP